MENHVQAESRVTDTEDVHGSINKPESERLVRLSQEMAFLNNMRDRFQVHRALLATLQELYSFSACSILVKGPPYELSIIPRYPLSTPFLEAMFEKIARAAAAIGFPSVASEDLAIAAYLDAPDELTPPEAVPQTPPTTIGDSLSIPLTADNR